MGKKKTSITLNDETLEDLDEMAQDSHRSRSGMISFLVDLFKAIMGGEELDKQRTGQDSDIDGK